jgi:hypothetical protein
LIIRIGDFDRAVLRTGRTAGALVLDNVARLFSQSDLEVTCLPLYAFNFGASEKVYIGVAAALQELRRFNAHGTVVGREGLIELRHLAAERRRFVDEVNLEARVGKIKSGLNTADAAADNHDISELALTRSFGGGSFKCFLFHLCRSLE